MLEKFSLSSFFPSFAKNFTQIMHLRASKEGFVFVLYPCYNLDSYLDPAQLSNIVDDRLGLITSVANRK